MQYSNGSTIDRVPQTSTSIDNYQVKDAWTETDDTRLRILATSLRENWNLIRLAIIIDCHQIGNDYLNYPIRSARQCEEKWHNIQQPPSCDERMKKIYQANVTSDCNGMTMVTLIVALCRKAYFRLQSRPYLTIKGYTF